MEDKNKAVPLDDMPSNLSGKVVDENDLPTSVSSPKSNASSNTGGESGAFVRPITPSTSTSTPTSASGGSKSESWTKTVNPLAAKPVVAKPVVPAKDVELGSWVTEANPLKPKVPSPSKIRKELSKKELEELKYQSFANEISNYGDNVPTKLSYEVGSEALRLNKPLEAINFYSQTLANINKADTGQRIIQGDAGDTKMTYDASKNPSYSLYGIGSAMFQMGDYEQALTYYNEAKAADPSNSIVDFGIARSKQKLGLEFKEDLARAQAAKDKELSGEKLREQGVSVGLADQIEEEAISNEEKRQAAQRGYETADMLTAFSTGYDPTGGLGKLKYINPLAALTYGSLAEQAVADVGEQEQQNKIKREYSGLDYITGGVAKVQQGLTSMGLNTVSAGSRIIANAFGSDMAKNTLYGGFFNGLADKSDDVVDYVNEVAKKYPIPTNTFLGKLEHSVLGAVPLIATMTLLKGRAKTTELKNMRDLSLVMGTEEGTRSFTERYKERRDFGDALTEGGKGFVTGLESAAKLEVLMGVGKKVLAPVVEIPALKFINKINPKFSSAAQREAFATQAGNMIGVSTVFGGDQAMKDLLNKRDVGEDALVQTLTGAAFETLPFAGAARDIVKAKLEGKRVNKDALKLIEKKNIENALSVFFRSDNEAIVAAHDNVETVDNLETKAAEIGMSISGKTDLQEIKSLLYAQVGLNNIANVKKLSQIASDYPEVLIEKINESNIEEKDKVVLRQKVEDLHKELNPYERKVTKISDEIEEIDKRMIDFEGVDVLSPADQAKAKIKISKLEAMRKAKEDEMNRVISDKEKGENRPSDLRKNTDSTDENWGTINRNDGKGIVSLNKRQYEQELIRESTPLKTTSQEKRTEALSDEDILSVQKKQAELGQSQHPMDDAPSEILDTVEKMEAGEDVTEEERKTASNYLYNKYKELRALKKSPERMYTVDQIDVMLEQLGKDIELLESKGTFEEFEAEQANMQPKADGTAPVEEMTLDEKKTDIEKRRQEELESNKSVKFFKGEEVYDEDGKKYIVHLGTKKGSNKTTVNEISEGQLLKNGNTGETIIRPANVGVFAIATSKLSYENPKEINTKYDAELAELNKATPEATAGETIKTTTNEKANEDGEQKRGKDGEEDVTKSVQSEGEIGGNEVDLKEKQVLATEGAVTAAPNEEAGSVGVVNLEAKKDELERKYGKRFSNEETYHLIKGTDGNYYINHKDRGKSIKSYKFQTEEQAKKFAEKEGIELLTIAEQGVGFTSENKAKYDAELKAVEQSLKETPQAGLVLAQFGNNINEGITTLENAIRGQISMESGGFDKPFGVNIWTNKKGEIKYVGNDASRSKGLTQNIFAFDKDGKLLIEKSVIKSKEAQQAVEQSLKPKTEQQAKPITNEKSSQKTDQEGSTEGGMLEEPRDGGTQDEGGKESTELRAEEKEVEPTQAEGVKGNGKVGGYNPRFKSAKKIQGEETTIEMPDGETREAEYMVVESDDILASHNEVAFSDTEGFPKTADGRNANSRNYKGDNSAQLKVNDDARNLKSSIVISDTATTDGGVPIISTDGIVISGNGRTMAIKLSQKIAPEKYAAYKADLLRRAVKFGIDPKEIANMKNPVLVKIDKNVKDYSVKTFDDYNGKYQKEESPTDKAIKRSSIIKADKALKGKILDIVGRHETMSDLFENRQDRKELFNLLVANNIILKQETPKYLTDKGEFTPEGKDIVNDILIATILNPKTLEATNSVKAFRNKIINSLPVLSANYKLGDNSLEQNINDAVLLQSKIASMGSQEDFWTHLGQIGMFDVVDPDVVVINRMINNGADKFKKFIVAYNKSMEIDEESNLFGGDEVLTKQQVIDNLKQSNLNENERKVIANLEELYAANEQKRPIGNVEVVGGNEAEQETPKAEQPKPTEPTEKLTDPKNASDLAKTYRNKFGFTPQGSVWAARLFDAKAAFMSKVLGISKEDYYSQYWFGVNEGEGGLSQSERNKNALSSVEETAKELKGANIGNVLGGIKAFRGQQKGMTGRWFTPSKKFAEIFSNSVKGKAKLDAEVIEQTVLGNVLDFPYNVTEYARISDKLADMFGVTQQEIRDALSKTNESLGKGEAIRIHTLLEDKNFGDLLASKGIDYVKAKENLTKTESVDTFLKISNKPQEQLIAEAYHKAKNDGSNPALIESVESVIAEKIANQEGGGLSQLTEQSKENNVSLGVSGKGFLNANQIKSLTEEIESNYANNADELLSRKKDDIRTKMFNYDTPVASKTINGVDLRIAQGLTRNNKATYLLYADGGIIGEFNSVADAKAAIKFVEDRLIKNKQLNQDRKGSWTKDAARMKRIINMYEKADSTTAVHEMLGHDYLDRIIEASATNKESEADLRTIAEEYIKDTKSKEKVEDVIKALKDFDVENNKTAKGTSVHEWFATQAEQYFATEKDVKRETPQQSKMAKIFEAFRAHLAELYDIMNKALIAPSDPMKKVFRKVFGEENFNKAEEIRAENAEAINTLNAAALEGNRNKSEDGVKSLMDYLKQKGLGQPTDEVKQKIWNAASTLIANKEAKRYNVTDVLKKIAPAIEDDIESMRKVLQEIGTTGKLRQGAESILANPNISDEVKEKVAKMSEYTPETLKKVGLGANEVIDYYIAEAEGEVAGLEKIKSLLDKGEFDGYTEKVAIQQSLIGMYNKLAKFGATDQIRKEALNNAVDVAEQYINQGTSLGRAINAYKLLGSLTTEGRLVWAKRQTNKYVKPAHEALKENIRDLKAELKDAYKQVDYFFEQTLGREETEGQYKEAIAQYQAEIDALKARKPREPKPSKTAYKGVKATREFKESDLANFAKDILAGGLFQDMETMTAPQKLAYGIMEKKPTNISEFAKAFGRYLGKKIDPKELESLYVQTRDLLITKDLAFADGLSTNEQLRADLDGLEVANKAKIEELERKKAEAEAKIAAKAKKGEKKEHSEELADFVIKDAKKAMNGSIAKQKTYLDEILKALKEKTADVINKGKKDKIQTAKVSEVEAIKFALDAINNGGADANMWNDAVEQVKAKIKADNDLSQQDKDDLNLYLNDYTAFLYDNLLSENKIFKVIREKLIQSGYGNGTLVNWKQIIEGADGDVNNMREIIQKLVKNQLKDYDNVQVEKVLDAIVYKYDQEINKQRKKIADKYIEKELGDKKSTKKKTAAVQGKIGKLLVENRLGILKDGNEDMLNELAAAKGLKSMSEKDWKRAAELAENVENSADGNLKNRAIEEMTAFIASKQPLSFMNTASSLRFAGLLGRATTVAVNLISGAIEGSLLAGGRAIRGNTSFIKESFKGVSKGGFKDILFGGGINQASKTSVEVNSSGMPYFRALEYYEGKGKKIIKSGKYVGRVLDATDSVFQEMFGSGYDRVYLEKQFKLENPNATKAEIDQMVNDALSKTKYDEFYAQALQDVIKSGQKPTPANVKRRTYEILRESQVSQMAIDLSDLESREKTFKSEFKENKGLATLFGSMLAARSNVSRKAIEPVAAFIFRLNKYSPEQSAELAKKIGDVIPNKIMPFTRGVSNVIEKALEKDIVYGLTKSLIVNLGVNKMPTTTMEEKMAKARAEEKVKDLATTAIFTNILIYGVGSLLYAASKAWDDDEEKEGRNPEKTGVYPIQSQKTSIGSTSSAKERATPENTLVLFGQKIPLKWLGSIGAELSLTANINKALTKDSKSSGAEKVANAALDISESYMQQSFMMSQNDKQSVVALLRDENVNWDKVEDYLINDMISYGGSYILWSGFVNQSLQGARYLSGDKSYQEAKTISEKLQKQVGLAGITYDNKKPNYMGRPLEATEVNREGIQGFLGMFSKSYKSPTESWVENIGYKESLVGRNSKQLATIKSESFVPPSNEQYDDFTDNTRKLIGKGIEFAYSKRNEVVVPLDADGGLEVNKKTGKAYTKDEYTNKLLNDMSNAIEGYKRTELVNRLDANKYDRDEYLSKLEDYYYKLEDAMYQFYREGSIDTDADKKRFSDKVNSILPPPPEE